LSSQVSPDWKREPTAFANCAAVQIFYFSFFSFSHQNGQNSRTKEICNDVDYESDIENRACQSRKRSSDQVSSSAHKANSPIHPNQDIVRCVDKLQASHHEDVITKNGRYELIDIGKVPSESSIKLNSTVTPKVAGRSITQWNPNGDRINDSKHPTQSTSMTNINNNNDAGNQQLGLLRSRTHTKTLSTRISSLKRESKTTRTLSIGE
jgi:hypothetical protein